jgi:hypothetical protein
MEAVVTLAGWLETSVMGQFVRANTLLYPVANVVHLLAVMAFFTSVAVIDLHVIGVLQGASFGNVVRRFRGIAKVALLFLVPSGIVLFVPEAAAMVRNLSFQLKFSAIALGILNLLVFELVTRRAGVSDSLPRPARVCAALSLVIWLTAAAAGRFVAYA